MEMIFCIILYLIQIAKFVCIYDLFFKKKKRKGWGIILLILAGCFMFFGVTKLDLCNPIIPYTIFVLYEIVVIYKEINGKTILIGIWSTAILGLLDEISRVSVQRFLWLIHVENQELLEFTSNVFTLLFLVFLLFILKRKTQEKIEKVHISYYIFFLLLTFANALIITYLHYYVFKQIEANNKILVYIVFIGIAVGMFLEIAMVILLAISRTSYKEKDELNQKYLQLQQEHYKYLEERETETKKFRHDIKNHMDLLNDFLHEGKYDEAKDYVAAIYGKMESVGNTVSVNNGIVDAILNKFYSDAKKKQVCMKVSGHLPSHCLIEPFDLCTIFSNLLDNAVEAAAKSIGKCVEVTCGYRNDQLILVIENDYAGELKKANGKYKTVKVDEENHGYGLLNVERSVAKYSGYLKIETNERFVVSVALKNKAIQ